MFENHDRSAFRRAGTPYSTLFRNLVWTVSLLLVFCPCSLAIQLDDADKFSELRENIRQLEREVSKKFASMPIGFPDQQKQILKDIEGLKTKVVELRKQMDQTAIESYSADPDRNQQAGLHILQMAIACLEGRGNGERPFDPARTYELVSLLGRNGKPAPQLLNVAFQACLALQDFERADRILKKLEGQGIPIPEQVRSHLAKLKNAWAKELTYRERDQQKDDLPRVKLETEVGDIIVELFEDDCPNTVANFVALVEGGFYDNNPIFDVKPGNMARAGCPKGNGTGDPGYRIANEPTNQNSRRFFAGTLGMYHSGANTAGSQFFISYQVQPDNDLKFVAFGRIIEGLEVLYKLSRTEPTTGSINTSNPKKINRAIILRKRDHSYEPKKIPTLPPAEEASVAPVSDEPPKDADDVPDVAPPDDDGGR